MLRQGSVGSFAYHTKTGSAPVGLPRRNTVHVYVTSTGCERVEGFSRVILPEIGLAEPPLGRVPYLIQPLSTSGATYLLTPELSP